MNENVVLIGVRVVIMSIGGVGGSSPPEVTIDFCKVCTGRCCRRVVKHLCQICATFLRKGKGVCLRHRSPLSNQPQYKQINVDLPKIHRRVLLSFLLLSYIL